MKSAVLFAVVLAAAAWPAATASRVTQKAAADPAQTALFEKVEAAVLAERADDLKRARVDLIRMVAGESPSSRMPLVRYTIAYAAWRLAFAPGIPDAEQKTMLDDAVVQLESVLKSTPDDAEALALLGAVQGARIAKAPEMGMTLGPLSDQLIGRATRLAPSNPRALAVAGQSAFHTPPEYGGSASRAESLFRAALKIFEGQGANAPWPNWGRFDAHVWLGQVLADKGDKAGARAEYEKALKIAPNSSWVKNTLLPAVR